MICGDFVMMCKGMFSYALEKQDFQFVVDVIRTYFKEMFILDRIDEVLENREDYVNYIKSIL